MKLMLSDASGEQVSGTSFRQQCFTGTRRSDQKHAFRNPCSEFSELAGILEEINDFHNVPEGKGADQIIDQVKKTKIQVEPAQEANGWMTFFTTIIPFVIIFILFFFLLNQAQGGGSRVITRLPPP